MAKLNLLHKVASVKEGLNGRVFLSKAISDFYDKNGREPDDDEEYTLRREVIARMVSQKFGRDSSVIFSVCEKSTGELCIDFDSIVFFGKCQVKANGNDFFGNGQSYLSGVVTNPTWLDLIALADEQIQKTGNSSHIFFEDVHVSDESGETPEVKILYLLMGS